MKKKTIKSVMAMVTAAGLVAAMLSGCGSAGNGQESDGMENRKEDGLPGQKGDGLETGKDGGSDRPVAMGRYVETEIPLPEKAAQDGFVSLFYGRDDKLELYTSIRDKAENITGVRRFLREEEDWKEDEGWWDRVKPQDLSVEIRRVFYGLDGNYYFSAMTTENGYICHLYQVQDDGPGADMIPEAFQPEKGRTYGLIPTKIEVGKDGNILVHGFETAVCYRPDGEKMFSMEKAWNGSSESSTGYLTEEEFVTRVDSGVARYSLKSGQLIETIAYEGMDAETDEGLILFGDGDGGVFAASEDGLAHVNEGGSLWELLIDGSLNTMGMRNMYLQTFLKGEKEDYYGAFVAQGGKGMMLCHYAYDPDMAAAPPVTLTVYGLEDNSTVRQAASLFQKNHPEVKVELLNGANQDGKVSEETIRALNTELLGGQGADVLILDGLPARAYQEKGILMDLREVFERIQKENPVMEQVVAGFTEKDGGIYQMPARISVPIIMGTEPAIRAMESLDAMAGYEGDVPLIYTTTYENLLRMVANTHYKEMFGDDGTLAEEMLVKYLKSVKTLAERNGAKSMFTEEELERFRTGNNVAPYGIRNTETDFDQGRSGCGTSNLDGMYSAIIPEAVMEKHPEAQRESIGGIYFPKVLVGVNMATSQPELAKEFVRQIFDTEVQKEELYDGFPIGLEAQRINCENDRPNYSVSTGYEDYSISGSWPVLERREKIYELIRSVSVPVRMDETVMKMIVDGAADYLDGKATAEQAAGAIYRQIALYQAEQG